VASEREGVGARGEREGRGGGVVGKWGQGEGGGSGARVKMGRAQVWNDRGSRGRGVGMGYWGGERITRRVGFPFLLEQEGGGMGRGLAGWRGKKMGGDREGGELYRGGSTSLRTS